VDIATSNDGQYGTSRRIYELTESNGTVTRFQGGTTPGQAVSANDFSNIYGSINNSSLNLGRSSITGRIDYLQDINGNRITSAYSDPDTILPSSLTHSSGASLSFTYNTFGRIASATDSAGRTTTYTYSSFAATKDFGKTTLSNLIHFVNRKEQRREVLSRQTRGQDHRSSRMLRPGDLARPSTDGRRGLLFHLAVFEADCPQSAAA
jgi:YD repeat-containing protein